MGIERVTLIPPAHAGECAPITFTESILHSIDRSRQSVAVEIPIGAIGETRLAAHPGAAAGYAIVLTTIEKQTYSGYVEVVAEGTTGRFYWCGLAI
jgi:hypothetical protein